MRNTIIPCLTALTLATLSQAQAPSRPSVELRPVVGAYVPTGDQRDVFKDALLLGVQGGIQVTRRFHVVGNLAWIDGKGLFPAADRSVRTYQYDAGVEYNGYRESIAGWVTGPFIGVGVGGRTYDYAAAGWGTKTYVDGYGALGVEFEHGNVSVRVEGRDYVSRYGAPTPGASTTTRNDLTLGLGVAYHFGPR